MRYSASEKAETIKTVENSHLPAKQTLNMLDIPKSTFYRWCDLWLDGGVDTLDDKSPVIVLFKSSLGGHIFDPIAFLFDELVHNDDQLSHYRYERQFLGFSVFDQPIIERLENGIASG